MGAVVERHDGSELEVSLLGSFDEEAMRGEVDAAVRRWSLVRQDPGAVVELGKPFGGSWSPTLSADYSAWLRPKNSAHGFSSQTITA